MMWSAAILLIVQAGSARADEGEQLMHWLNQDCRYIYFSSEVVTYARSQPLIWKRYQERVGEVESQEGQLAAGTGDALALLKAQRDLEQFFRDEIQELALRGRKSIRETPFTGRLTFEVPIEIAVRIGRKSVTGRLEGNVITENGSIILKYPVVVVDGKGYWLASRSGNSHEGFSEIARALGYRSGSGGSQVEKVYSANPVHPSNWWHGKRRFLIYDPKISAFRPVSSADIRSAFQINYYPNRIKLSP